jgi:hypothetical protein
MRVLAIVVALGVWGPLAEARADPCPPVHDHLAVAATSAVDGDVHVVLRVDPGLDGADVRLRWQAQPGDHFDEVPFTRVGECDLAAELGVHGTPVFLYYVVALDDVGGVLASLGSAAEPIEIPFETGDSMGFCEDADCSCAPHMFWCAQPPNGLVVMTRPRRPAARARVVAQVTGGIVRAGAVTRATLTPELDVRILRTTWIGVAVRAGGGTLVLGRIRQALGHGVALALSVGGGRTALAGASLLIGHALTGPLELVAEGGALVDLDGEIMLGVAAGLALRR